MYHVAPFIWLYYAAIEKQTFVIATNYLMWGQWQQSMPVNQFDKYMAESDA